jgi:hypothetical protein
VSTRLARTDNCLERKSRELDGRMSGPAKTSATLSKSLFLVTSPQTRMTFGHVVRAAIG